MAHIHHSTGTIVATIQYINNTYILYIGRQRGPVVRDTDL